ncbi:proton-coupled folate transporter isoform X3 [Hydra vulgaris]|uniref:Proton-coupled folate transporter isoform X3 n=1 Tax=Hydra vulgaris TaxID=6087 RepID=A0ABM4BT38_HYDVU
MNSVLSLSNSFGRSFDEFKQIQIKKSEEVLHKKVYNETIYTEKKTVKKHKLRTFFEGVTVEPVTFCYACALILHAPLIQQYIYQRISEDYQMSGKIKDDVSGCELSAIENDNVTYEIRKNVQSLTSYIHLGIILSAALPSLFMALLLGTWSDKVGRRIVLFLPVLGGLLDCTCILITMFTRAPLFVLFIGSFINGLGGFFTTMILAVFSYIADITDEDNRAMRLGVLEAVAFTSGMISHMTSGWWIHHLGFKAPYIFIFALHSVGLVYITFVLPESSSATEKLHLKDLFCRAHFKKVINLFTKADSRYKWQLYGLAVTSALMMISSIGFGSVIVLFALDAPFCFSPIMIGYFLADCMFMQALGAVFSLMLLRKYFSEIFLTQLGIASIIASLVMIALITKRWQMFLVPLAGCFGGVCMPVIRARMSKLVDNSEQGTLFAAVATLETLCTLFGAGIFNSLYPYSVQHLNFKGFTFLVMAGLLIIPVLIMCVIGLNEHTEKDISTSPVIENN